MQVRLAMQVAGGEGTRALHLPHAVEIVLEFDRHGILLDQAPLPRSYDTQSNHDSLTATASLR